MTLNATIHTVVWVLYLFYWLWCLLWSGWLWFEPIPLLTVKFPRTSYQHYMHGTFKHALNIKVTTNDITGLL